MCKRNVDGAAYGSYPVKNPREDQVLGYDALALGDVVRFNFLLAFRVCGTGNHDLVFYVSKVQASHVIR